MIHFLMMCLECIPLIVGCHQHGRSGDTVCYDVNDHVVLTISSVFRGAAMGPPRKIRKHFLTRYTVQNGISNLYILLKSALKMQEMPFQRPKFQISGGHAPGLPYNCVVTMASPSLKSWLRHCLRW